jgi:CheY-like chemotaxis protein
MPGMDGIETARQIGDLGLRRPPHLMMVTAYGREEAIKGAEEAGLEDVLIKPVNPSTLFDSVVRILGGATDAARCAGDLPTGAFERLDPIRGARILLVEDNDLNQQVATEMLTDAGFVVDLAENGQIAVDKVRAGNYDMVLMDMQMPVMDGIAATRAIRSEQRFGDLPVVAMTANARQGDRDRCLEAGMNDHVAKPIEPDELWNALLKWIAPHRSTATAGMKLHSAAELTLPVGIDGVDMTAGLRRVLGKRPLYLSMLHKFEAGQGVTLAAIATALDLQDANTAERLAHTLKGVAGNIGAGGLQQLAEALEAAIHGRHPRQELDARLEELKGPLDALIAQLQQKLPRVSARAVMAVDPHRLAAVHAQLERLLTDNDAQAADFLDANADLLYSAYPDCFHEIENGIHSYNFEVALAALRSATAITT